MKFYEIYNVDFKGRESILASSEYLHSLMEMHLHNYIDEIYNSTPTGELLDGEYFENVVEFKDFLNETLDILLNGEIDFIQIKQRFNNCGMNNYEYNKIEIREIDKKGWDK